MTSAGVLGWLGVVEVDPLSVEPDPLSVEPDPLGVYPLGVYPLGVYPLELEPLEVEPESVDPLGVYPLGTYPLGFDPLEVGSVAFDEDNDSVTSHLKSNTLASCLRTCPKEIHSEVTNPTLT